MKKNLNKIIIGISVLVVVGIGSVIIINNKESNEEVEVVETIETEVTYEAAEPVVKAPEVEAPEAEIKEVVVKQEYWKQASPLPVSYPVAEETEVVEQDVVAKAPEVIEVESTVIKEEAPATESNYDVTAQASLSETGHYDAAKDVTEFASTPISCVDFASNANLIALQAQVNPLIDADGGCNNGFILKNGKAIVSYVGEAYYVDCSIGTDGTKATLTIGCNLNDIAWQCMTAVMNEIYPGKGDVLISEVKADCISGTNTYSTLDSWTEFNGLHTKCVVDTNDNMLVYVFK